MSNSENMTINVTGQPNCSAWLRERFEGTRQIEQLRYLLPLEGSFSSLDVMADQDGLPTGWGLSQYGRPQQTAPDGSPWPTVAKVARGQLGEFLNFDVEVILDHLISGEDQRRAKAASHFLIVWGKWDTRPDFAHLQTCLAACRAAIRGGCVGVIDVFAKRWMTLERLARIPTDKFAIEDHIMVQIGQGFCVTAGLSEKFMREDVLMRVPDASFNDHATFLLNEIAHNVSSGKRYDETSLFRWRQNGHMCQTVFKKLPPEECTILPSDTVLEAVDVTGLVAGGEVQGFGAGDDAELTLREFELAAPHALKLYGWPPKPLPTLDLTPPLNILGIVPGSHDLNAAVSLLGQPHAVVENSLYRWAFDHQNWKETVFVQIQLNPETGRVKQVSGNSFTLGGATATDQHQFTQIQSFLGQPELSREVLLAPDDTPLRTDYLKLYANSTLGRGCFALKLEVDDQGSLCLATLTFLENEPGNVLEQMTPHYAGTLLEGYRQVSAMPATMGGPSRLAEELQVYLDFAEHIYGLVLQQCSISHPVWTSDDAILKAKMSGAMLFLGRNPSPQEWSDLPISFQLMRGEFASIEACRELPEVKRGSELYVKELGVDGFSYVCFHCAAMFLKADHPDIPDNEIQTYLAMMVSSFDQNKATVRGRAAEVLG